MNSTQITQAPEYTLTLNDQDLQVLAQALENIAFKFASPIFNKINEQLKSQLPQKSNSDQTI